MLYALCRFPCVSAVILKNCPKLIPHTPHLFCHVLVFLRQTRVTKGFAQDDGDSEWSTKIPFSPCLFFQLTLDRLLNVGTTRV